jgi:hypothetical protein
MAVVVSVADRRRRKAAEEHVRALVLFECAASLGRQQHRRETEPVRRRPAR